MRFRRILKHACVWLVGFMAVGGADRVFAQVQVESPIYTEDFGVVPADLHSLPGEWCDGSNLNTLRLPINFDGKNRGVIGDKYTFAARKHTYETKEENGQCLEWNYIEWEENGDCIKKKKYPIIGEICVEYEKIKKRKETTCKTYEKVTVVTKDEWQDNTMADVDGVHYHNGTYALAVDGAELGKTDIWISKITTWHHDLDHTGNNGLALLANSSGDSPSAVFAQTVSGLQPGQLYQLNAYAGNAENGNASLGLGDIKIGFSYEPNIKFDILSGSEVLGEVETGSIAYSKEAVPWQAVGLICELPAGVSQLAYRIQSMKGETTANVFVVDDISLSPITLKVSSARVSFCKYPGYAAIEAEMPELSLDGFRYHSRLMRRAKSGGDWAWCSATADTLEWKVDDVDWLSYDYRIAVGLGTVALNAANPNDERFLNDFGYYSLTDNLMAENFCLDVTGLVPDYTVVEDSVRLTPNLSGAPEGAKVYSRWMRKNFGDGATWAWMDVAREETANRTIDWVDFSNGDFRCVYALSARLLDALDCQTVQDREAYAVAFSMEGVHYEVALVGDPLDDGSGAVKLLVEVDGVPMGARMYSKWMQRTRGGEGWVALPGEEVTRQIGLVTYSKYEYRVAVTPSSRTFKAMQVNALTEADSAYRLTNTKQGSDWRLGEFVTDFCEQPGVALRVQRVPFENGYDVPVTARWRQRTVGAAEWEWMPGVVPSSIERLSFDPDMADYVTHDYDLVISWSRDSLDAWVANALPAERDYYILQTEFDDAPLCIAVDTIRILSERRDELILHPEVVYEGNRTVYGRWLRTEKSTGDKSWASETLTKEYDYRVSPSEFERYDYRFYASVAEAVVTVDAGSTKDAAPYFAMRELAGRHIAKPEVTLEAVACVDKQDSNLVTLRIAADAAISSLNYRLGSSAVVTLEGAPERVLEFKVDKDSVFCLTDYALDGVCDRIVRDDSTRIQYVPKLHIDHFTDVFGCRNNTVSVQPKVTGGSDVAYEWIRGGAVVAEWANEKTLQVTMTGTGAEPLRLAVSGEGVCPADSTVYLITGEHPVTDRDGYGEAMEVCVGETFTVPFRTTDADQYRVTMRSTTMSDFAFYPATSPVKGDSALEILNGQVPLTATDRMANAEFTFRVQLYKVVVYNGVSYRCEDEFEVRYTVRPNPTMRYASVMRLCAGERLQSNPQVELNGNMVESWRWRLWDGTAMTETTIATTQDIDAEVVADMDGKRLQLLATTGCGEVPVQDTRLEVFVADSNRLTAPSARVVTDDKIVITGTEMTLSDARYEWSESMDDGATWKVLAGEVGSSMTLYASEESMLYRRTLVGEGWSCPGMEVTVRIEVFNNEEENRIYLLPADTLVYSGTEITVHSDCPQLAGVGYQWEKNDDGVWTVMEGENGKTLLTAPETITMYRRGAVVNGVVMYSNSVIANVYDRSRNRIMYAGGVVPRNTEIHVTGNYLDIPGVTYRWFSRPDSLSDWSSMAGQEGWNMTTVLSGRTTYMRCVYLPTQSDSIASNELTIYVFDNETDNKISCDYNNVCRDGVVRVTGTVVADDHVAYRWECSYDGGREWLVTDSVGSSVAWVGEKDVMLRRRVLYASSEGENYSNMVSLNVIHNDTENRIWQTGAIVAGKPGEVEGTAEAGGFYRWEISRDGETDWQVVGNAEGAALHLDADHTKSVCWLRRQLRFTDGGGCEEYSNTLKVKVIDPDKSNVVTLVGDYHCQWTPVAVEGTDLSELDASYHWYRQTDGEWELMDLYYLKDLSLNEGVGRNTSFRRDVVVDGEVYPSNVVEVPLWRSVTVRNEIEDVGEVCAGVPLVIHGSDAMENEVDLSDYIASYHWEVSRTGAADTWERVDSAGGKDLSIPSPELSAWYCRVITTHCGDYLRSEPVYLTVRDRLALTLRSDAKFGQMSVKTPITVSVDEDIYDTYEFRIDGQVWENEGRICRIYGWQPDRIYGVKVRVEKDGCVQQDSLHVYAPDVDLPNVLTPNNDGLNEVLLEGYDLNVYNRWGNQLYSGHDGWDGRYKGKIVPAGTYFYVVRVRFENGRTAEYKRSVTIKR